jgi:hypothetical protein
MSEAGAGGASEVRSAGGIDAPTSGEAVIRLLPTATSRRIPAAKVTQLENAADDEAVRRFTQLPREAGWLLMTAGVVGLVVPGILGTPFLLAGAVVVVPGGPKLLSRWVGRNPPKIVHSAMRQISRFVDDLERRYPRR